ncbi:MAG: hypothetical protein JST52_02075 [Bacteroidetes bacterium]|nr:hypothetical protein [Bacteroidota bacterium]MBS1739905.1 hypothetical protein [Bacteroidota bacterium]
MRHFIRFIFFGNIFYGICAIALSIEANIQQSLPLNGFLFYLLSFIITVVYYDVAYITEKPGISHNPRTIWYAANLKNIKRLHLFLMVLFSVGGIYLLKEYWRDLRVLPWDVWLLIFTFPLAAILYYGVNHKSVKHFSLRDVGWLKPFIIGFSWSGLVTVYPIIYYCIIRQIPFHISLLGFLLFVKNFMFISMLCILFDIKDYATDYNQRLKTLVVKLGLRKIIFIIIIPLTVIGLGSFLAYGLTHGFSMFKILMNTLPFLLLISVAYSMKRRRNIFYYLVIIDGLMLVKAFCGIIGSLCF